MATPNMHNQSVISSFLTEVVKEKLKKAKVFGVGVESFMVIQKPSIPFLNVPVIVRLCADEILTRGIPEVLCMRL